VGHGRAVYPALFLNRQPKARGAGSGSGIVSAPRPAGGTPRPAGERVWVETQRGVGRTMHAAKESATRAQLTGI